VHGPGAAFGKPLLKTSCVALLLCIRQGDDAGFRKTCFECERTNGIAAKARCVDCRIGGILRNGTSSLLFS
jgi:hypothetical protein